MRLDTEFSISETLGTIDWDDGGVSRVVSSSRFDTIDCNDTNAEDTVDRRMITA